MPSAEAALLALQVVERISPQARSIRIEVRPDGRVLLVIPRHVPKRAAYDFLRSREDWVRRKVVEWQQHPKAPAPQPPRWDGRDRIPLRGVRMPLLLVPTRSVRPLVRIDEAITLFCAPAQTSLAARATSVRRSLRELARRESLHLLQDEATRLGVDFEGPRVADQRSLWGSCTPAGLISLNWRLILAPTEVLRYVVIHELCHRRHLNHSKRFWHLVNRQMPDFENWRAWLREHGAGLHAVLPKAGSDEPNPQFDLLGDGI